MNRKNIFLLILMLAFLIVVGGYSLYRTFITFNQFRSIASPTAEPQAEQQEETARRTTITYGCKPEKTALELLQETASNVQIRQYSFGTQVLAINGVEQGSGKFWLYKVGGKEATVAADLYTCQDKEEIKWELR